MIRSAAPKVAFLAAIFLVFESFSMTSNNPYDPLPLYSSADPHEFLYTTERDRLLGLVPEIDDERVNFTISPFGQKATKAKNSQEQTVMLGDMLGLWNMLALTYDFCPTMTALTLNLQEAAKTTFAGTFGVTSTSAFDPDNPLFTPNPNGELFFGQESALTNTTVSELIGPNFGMVSAPIEYKKYGSRFEASMAVFSNVGFRLQGGYAEIQQSLTSTGTAFGFIDRSADFLPQDSIAGALAPVDFSAVKENLYKVNRVLTDSDQVFAIADDLGLDVSDFRKSGFEDIRGSLFWLNAIPFNHEREGWPRFLLTPFVQLFGVLAIGPTSDACKQFSVPFGNNGHDSIGFNAGLSINFEETLELVVEGGGTFFSSENAFVRFPVHLNQRGILPCAAEVTVKPGNNWHLIGTINARRFVDKLSAYAQFAMVSHNKDTISNVPNPTPCIPEPTLNTPTPCPKYRADLVEENSQWNWRMFNLALNYEIAPCISIGAVYQAPLSRKNAPRTKTIVASFVTTF